MKHYEILPCGHTALLNKKWTATTCPTCGKRYEVCQ
jgi:hypothetical protein